MRRPHKRPGLTMALASVLAWTGVSITTLFWSFLIAVVFLVHRLVDPDLALAHRLASCWGKGLVAMAPGSRVTITGLERVPKGKPVIFMANHQSYVDVPVLFHMPGQFKWMADVDLFRIPFFGWSMGMAGYVPVDRGNAQAGMRSLESAKRWLEKGISIFIFPEGTRSHTGVFGRYQMGGFRLAAEAKVPIVPVVLTGTRQLLPRGNWIFRWDVLIRIHVLPALQPALDLPSARTQMRSLRTQMWKAFAAQRTC